MNLIEQLGGYEKAKEWYDENTDKEWVGIYHIPKLYLALLEYRRENGFFEVGDKVVFNSYKLDAGISVIHNYHNGCIGAVFRHVTDDEIKVGHRI